MAYFINQDGRQGFIGTQGEYDQVDFAGDVNDYTFARMTNGRILVRHVETGQIDVLGSIEGLWFTGSQQWFSMDDAIRETSGIRGFRALDGVIEGNDLNNILIGANGDDTFADSFGHDRIFGRGGFDQINYEGSFDEYQITMRADGRVSISNAMSGVDIVDSIEGLWFNGSQQWFSMADALAAQEGLPSQRIDDADGVIFGYGGRDILRGDNGDNAFFGGMGNDVYIGRGGFDQVNFEGALSDYTLSTNSRGWLIVDSGIWGTDTLVSIEGLWFNGEQEWYSVADIIAELNGETTPEPEPEPEPETETSTGVLVNGIITGTNEVDDTLLGGNGNDTFYAGRGFDLIRGGNGNDTLRVDGDLIEWTMAINADGELIMTHPSWGQNIVEDVENIVFLREGASYLVDDAISLTANLPDFRLDNDDVINGTNLDDQMIFGDGDQSLYGGLGDDFYNGGDGFDQINYDGALSEWLLTDNGNGTYTATHDIWGTDTFTNIEGLFFNGGGGEFVAVADFFG